MRYLPVSIDTKNKKILVVGGGPVAYRKVQTLLKTQISIDLVAIDFIEDFKNIENNPRLNFTYRRVDEDFELEDIDYLLIATDSKKTNDLLEQKAREKKIPFLNASNSENSDFIMTKVLEDKGLSVSLSTGGKNPTLLGIFSDQVEDLLADLDQEKIEELNKIRKYLKAKGEKDTSKIIRDLYFQPIEIIKKYGEENCK